MESRTDCGVADKKWMLLSTETLLGIRRTGQYSTNGSVQFFVINKLLCILFSAVK